MPPRSADDGMAIWPCENLARVRRLYLTLPLLSLLAVLGLAGCRTAPAVAAYVEDVTITTDQLADAVEERMADENIAAAIEPGDAGYQVLVLDQLVQQAIYRILSADYDVEVTDRAVDDRLDELLAGDGSQTVADTYARIASEQMLSELDVREEVRRILIREEVAAEEGLDAPIQEPALRQRYEETKDQLSTIELGFITVPDQGTADAVLESLVADPSSYPVVAATYAGPNTAPEFISGSVAEVPGELLPSVQATAVGQGFTLPLPQAGGIVVGYVAAVDVPAFEDVREQVRSEAAGGVEAAVTEIVTEFASGLDIDINPRYGALNQGRVVPSGQGGVVRILEDASTT